MWSRGAYQCICKAFNTSSNLDLSLKCRYCRHGKHSVVATLVMYSKTFMACTRALVFVLNVRLCRSRLVSPVIIQNFHTLCTSRKYNSRRCTIFQQDTFNHITLEIPRVSKLDFGIVLIRDHGEEEAALPVKYCVSVAQTGTVSDLVASLSSISGVQASRLKICNVIIERCHISQLYRYVQHIFSFHS